MTQPTKSLSEILVGLPARHRAALEWFVQRTGTIQDWPATLDIGGEETFLATKAKGIYKPAWSEYSLSVRQTIGGPYPDEDPVVRADATWLYKYFQENADTAQRDKESTNRGLMACMHDRIPVAVMRQTSGKPHVQYRIEGLALVSGWDDGFFFLEGFAPSGFSHPPGPGTELELLAKTQTKAATASGEFDPKGITDARQKTIGTIVRRRGQPEFRKALLSAYGGKCALTNCDAVEALEAAHITPYLGAETNHIGNGLLLRADIHTLFDLGLIAIDETSLEVRVAPSLVGTSYGSVAGSKLRSPEEQSAAPSKQALKSHREWSKL